MRGDVIYALNSRVVIIVLHILRKFDPAVTVIPVVSAIICAVAANVITDGRPAGAGTFITRRVAVC